MSFDRLLFCTLVCEYVACIASVCLCIIYSRLEKLLKCEGSYAMGGETDKDDLYIAPTIITHVNLKDAIMCDEVSIGLILRYPLVAIVDVMMHTINGLCSKFTVANNYICPVTSYKLPACFTALNNTLLFVNMILRDILAYLLVQQPWSGEIVVSTFHRASQVRLHV